MQVAIACLSVTDREVYDQPVKKLPPDSLHHLRRPFIVSVSEQPQQQLEYGCCARPRPRSAAAQRLAEAKAQPSRQIDPRVATWASSSASRFFGPSSRARCLTQGDVCVVSMV
jgi:hypothetical protein